MRERRRRFKVKVVLIVISVLSGGLQEMLKELENMSKKMIFVKGL